MQLKWTFPYPSLGVLPASVVTSDQDLIIMPKIASNNGQLLDVHERLANNFNAKDLVILVCSLKEMDKLGLIPLIAVAQENKGKVHLVLIYHEMNGYVDTYMSDADMFAEVEVTEIKRSNISILDLQKAYFQVCIHKSLCPFQTVLLKGHRYCLTLIGFRLNMAPTIIKSILNAALSEDKNIQQTSTYIDNIYVNESIASMAQIQYLADYGLTCKKLELLRNGA